MGAVGGGDMIQRHGKASAGAEDQVAIDIEVADLAGGAVFNGQGPRGGTSQVDDLISRPAESPRQRRRPKRLVGQRVRRGQADQRIRGIW